MNVIFVEKKQRNPASILGVEHLQNHNRKVVRIKENQSMATI